MIKIYFDIILRIAKNAWRTVGYCRPAPVSGFS